MYRSKIIKHFWSLPVIGTGRWRYWLMVMGLSLFSLPGFAQISLNVKNFGAVGDAVQFYANTVSNSDFITTTSVFSSADIGKAIEVSGCGSVTVAPNCQDMVTTIASVVDGTNIYLNQTCQRTLTNTFATVGTDNSLAISNAIQSVVSSGSPNTIINVPAGKYLCLANWTANGPVSVLIKGGGWHLIGEGVTNTILLGQGAWTNQPDIGARRGFLLAVLPPVANDYPVSLENLTLDGGVEQGNTDNHRFPASSVDGSGWDTWHDAIDVRGNTGNAITRWTWKNLLFTHWRGEMVKSNGQAKNGNLLIEDCIFRDGNATAINIYDSLIITNCIFENMFQIGEYYQAYSTNANYLVNNLFTNITGNGFAINGGKGNNPNFTIRGNTFFGVNGNGVMTTPGDNVFVTSNQFYNVLFPIVLGSPGYQGTYVNSNITVSFNTMSNSSVVFQILGGSPSDQNRVVNAKIYGNTSTIARSSWLQGQWAENIQFYSNVVMDVDGSNPLDGIKVAVARTGTGSSPYLLIDTNNVYWTPRYDLTGNKTNFISYAGGSRYQVIYQYAAGTKYALTTTDASQVPAGASIIITNSYWRDTGSGTSFPVYLNSDLSGDPVVIGQNEARMFYWNKVKGGYAWMTHQIIPPLNLRTNL